MAVEEISTQARETLESRIRTREALIGIVGLGYVGLPLAVEFARAGMRVVGIDVDDHRVAEIGAGRSYIPDVSSAVLQDLVKRGSLRATVEFPMLAEADAVVICVQTPFTAAKEPDLRFVVAALGEVANRLHPGELVVLQSTTYPGTTEEVALPLLAASGLRVGEDYFLAFSPERVDPGNTRFSTRDIPKVVGGITPACAAAAQLLFEQVVTRVYRVSSARVAELTKLLENVFRSVNIALVNELTLLCDRMGVDVWEVIGAAATKPFGFMPFYPGPGVGGHCIPVDPYYLSSKAKEYDFNTRFIVLAAEINENMPYYVADRVTEAINVHARKSISSAGILGLGVAYKAGIGDVRKSPAVKVLERLGRRGASIAYHDPYVARIRIHGQDYASVPLTAEEIGRADCVLILTDHPGIDYGWVVKHASLVFDTRNATKSVGAPAANVLKL
ncbi:MAG TPA: nucleotide sugar dehydrogenase [bacterium]|nr:nucleotide sugar dehydrogenase [bacterium]